MLLARRNLMRDRTRFLLGVVGVAISVGLILLLAGYRAGVYRQASAYLDNSPGSVLVAERGIRDFLGTSSVLPDGALDAVRQTPGVDAVVPIVSQFVIFERHSRKDGFFLVGYDPTIGGGPWKLVAGRPPTGNDEIVMDRVTAGEHDLALGDNLTLLDRRITVVGLSDENTFWAGSIAFARLSTLEELLRAPGLRSFLLVTPSAGISAPTLRDRLVVPGTEALLKSDVIANDAKLMARVYDAPIGVMVGMAFVVGVLIVGLIVYTATLERRREYGALKAIGASNGTLYRIVAIQATTGAALGGVIGLLLAFGAVPLLTLWRPQFLVVIDPPIVAVVLASSFVTAALGALIPARSMARLEPAEVFRA